MFKIDFPLDNGAEIILYIINQSLSGIKWFIEYSGSLGMFILTLFVVMYAKKTLKLNQEIVEQEKQNIIENKRPEVIVYFDVGEISELYFLIKNIGKSPAINTKINMVLERGKVITDSLNVYSPLKKGIATLAPNQELKTFFAMTSDVKDSKGEFPVYKAIISYEDQEQRKYNEEFTLDINMFKGRLRLGVKDMHDLVKVVEKIEQKIN